MNLATYFATLNPMGLLKSIPGGVAQGLIWGILAIGVYLTFRVLDVADMTVDGSFATGGAVTVMLILADVPVWIALLVAIAAGILAGIVTGILHTLLGIPPILAGILTQFALYSINLHIMNMAANQSVNVDAHPLLLSSRYIPKSIVISLVLMVVVIAFLYWFFGTEIGSAVRATGCNPNMSSAQGIDIRKTKVLGLALSNGLVALSGGLFAQYQGFADINMGRGAIVIGLAAVIIGEVLYDAVFRKHHNFAGQMLFIFVGAILYYLVVILVLWLRLNSNDLKLFTALVVAIFLAVPNLKAKRSRAPKPAKSVEAKEEVEDHA